MPLKITVDRSQKAELPFGTASGHGILYCISSTETGPNARTFLEKGTEEDEGMTPGAYKADHMSGMRRFQFADSKASNIMLKGARSSREEVEGLEEDWMGWLC